MLPFYRELESDLKMQGCELINSYAQHQYIADFDYYEDVKELTPKTYFNLEDVPKTGGPFVVKGRTNSRKFQWATKMFAPSYEVAARLHHELSVEDPLIADQGVIVRELAQLEVPEIGISGTPFANEWRFFFLGNQRLSFGYYWSIAEKRGEMDSAGLEFAQQVADIISKKANFFVVDIAKTAGGGWTLIEINDGQMSGLSDNDPQILYTNLSCFAPLYL